MHKRVLALDVGDRRIGVAVSDPMGITAQPVGIIDRTQTAALFDEIMKTARDYEAETIVVGLPKRLNGTSSPQTEKVEVFLEQLREQADIPILTWDERFTTRSAEASLIESNVRRKKRKKLVDCAAAQIMLQHFLDCNRPQDGDMHENH